MNIENIINQQGVFCYFLGGDQLDLSLVEGVRQLLSPLAAGISARTLHNGRSIKVTVTHERDAERTKAFAQLKDFAREKGLAFAIYPDRAASPEFKVALMDMDSTLINQEVIEELAEFAGVRAHVANVTKLAMEGKLDFRQALRERVKLLANQPESILETVYRERITETGGLQEMIAGFKKLGIGTAVVSGGFAAIVDRFAAKVGLDHARANLLEVVDGKLTGNVTGGIVDADVKRAMLDELCEKYNAGPDESIAIGDGANDLKMMQASGLGVAFCAKPIVQEQALAAINRRRLDDVLLLMDE
ncbi:phosphoserine phosphatase SerB [Candidatus Sumerlaeota bacterium]|nr:phosphoserine phosphatase SerB [Candidatus Sumerlaeota bacterium]